MIHNHKMSKKYTGIILSIFIGIAAFWLIYGFTPLNVTNDRWIMEQYDERDIITHYAGWEAYRDYKWAFPLGYTDNMAHGQGFFISFTDSIPWVAIAFKLINGILPKTFQYLGLFTLLCYILQTVAAYMIIKYKTDSTCYSLIGSILFSFAPILMERAFRHTALGAQWLILFSMYLYFLHKDTPAFKNHIWQALLMVLSIGIHPYFLPMIACFALLCVSEDVKNKKYKNALVFPAQIGVTYLAGYIIGVVGHGVSSYRSGYGHYSMNINAVINPTSIGGYQWSKFFPVLPSTSGNYDGFNYLGAGVVAGLAIAILLILIFGDLKNVTDMIKRHILLLGTCVFLTCFALSHRVSFNDRIITEIPLPDTIIHLGGIFRSSGRMFYPVYYLLIVWIILSVWRMKEKIKKPAVYISLIFIVMIQLIDISGCIVEKHINMDINGNETSILNDAFLNQVFANSDELLGIDMNRYDKRQTAVLALKNDVVISYELTNSGEYDKAEAIKDKKIDQIINSGELGNYIIMLSDESEAQRFAHCKDVIIYHDRNSIYVFKDKGYNLQ